MSIPQVSGPVPMRGLRHLDPDRPVQSLVELARRHGSLFTLQVPDRRLVVVSEPALMTELSDPRRFRKRVSRPLQQLRDFAGDGLFTAESDSPAWENAHRILTPAFGGSAMADYHEAMTDAASQLLQRWLRCNPGEPVDVSHDFTRLTLETIGMCGFGFRFHCFRSSEPHPFVRALTEALDEAMRRCFRPPWEGWLDLRRRRRYQQNLELLFHTVDDMVAERRRSGRRRADLLDRMLASGELTDREIRDQMLTFLVAGHETTSGLLSFALRALLEHPQVLERVRDEVEEVVGAGYPGGEQVGKLRYLEAVLKETLRLWPTAPLYTLAAIEPTTLSTGLEVTPQDDLLVLLPALQRNSGAWSDPDRFQPERFLGCPHDPARRCAYRPFGHGKRTCIGRRFAMHEAALVLAILLPRLDFESDPGALEIRETLTVKPHDFRVRPRARRPVPAIWAA